MIGNPHTGGMVSAWLVPRGKHAAAEPALSDENVDWMATIGLASRDYALAMLTSVLKESGLFDRVPEEVAAYLDYALRANAEANGLIREQVLAIGHVLDDAGIGGVTAAKRPAFSRKGRRPRSA